MARARGTGATATTRARKARVTMGTKPASAEPAVNGEAAAPEIAEDAGESAGALVATAGGEVIDHKTAALVKDAGYQKLVEECQKQFAGVIERYWNIGKKIDGFLSRDDNEKRYGRRLFQKLSADSGVAGSALYDGLRFYRADRERGLIDRLTGVAWGKTRRLLPLLDAPEARDAVIEELPTIQAMSPEMFTREWIPEAYEKHLGKAPRGRKPGQRTDPGGPLGRAMKILEGMAAKGKLDPVVKELDNSDGFVAVIGWDGVGDPSTTTKLLQQLLARIQR